MESDTSAFHLNIAINNISIHAPRMGSDVAPDFQSFDIFVFQSTLPAWGATMTTSLSRIFERFQSTLPAWGATIGSVYMSADKTISIHAPRMGSD